MTMTKNVEKRMIINRLLTAWMCAPTLRLGQLISNATNGDDVNKKDIFYITDSNFIEKIEDYIKEM